METDVLTSTWSDRLKRLRQILNVSGAEFSQATGIMLPTLRSIEQGQVKNPTGEVLGRIFKTYGVSIKWLVLGEGPIFDDPSELEKELDRTRDELQLTRQQVEHWKTEAGNQERIAQGLLLLGATKPVVRKPTRGKLDDVVPRPLQRGRIGHDFYQLGNVAGYVMR